MSSWKCDTCGLFNSSWRGKCVACFNYNKNKLWKCPECDFMNKSTIIKCCACFTFKKPLIKISNKWEMTYLTTQPSYNYKSKIISWNNKLYTIMVLRSREKEKMEILMLDHSEHERYEEITNSDASQYNDEWIYNYYKQIVSFCMNKKKGEIYIIVHGISSDVDVLIIYDLNKEKIKKEWKLNYAKEIEMDIIKEIRVIDTDEKNDNILHQIPFIVINEWRKSDILQCSTDKLLPRDIYILINKFYSICAHDHLQVIILCLQYGRPTYIHHAIINIENMRKDEIDLNIITSKCIRKEEFHIIFHQMTFRNDDNVYIIFAVETWKIELKHSRIDIQNGTINCTKYLNAVVKVCTGDHKYGPRKIVYDICNEWRNHNFYALILGPNVSSGEFESGDVIHLNIVYWLIQFDRENEEFVSLQEDVLDYKITVNGYILNDDGRHHINEWKESGIYKDNVDLDMLFHDGYLYIAAGKRRRYIKETIIFKAPFY